jgi:hypothetical protein
MKVAMQKAADASEIVWRRYKIALQGRVLDDRGRAAVEKVAANSEEIVPVRYNPETFEMEISGRSYGADSLADAFRSLITGPVILEATTLGFVEILLTCRTLHEIGITAFDLLYVEPKRYRNPRRRHLLHRRDFELSSDVPGYHAIPGHAILLGDRNPQKAVFFVGYEEARLRRAFEDLQMIRSSRSAVTFGVPAYNPGWEMDSIANNIGVIREQNIRGGVYFCGAENPAAVIELLSELHSGLHHGERLFVAPIGTKPHGIGVALFASRRKDVGVIYDHPQRTKGRSNEIAHWHLFSTQTQC